MSYVQVEADERLEEGPQGLQFKSFLGTDTGTNGQQPARAPGSGRADRGYLTDEAAPSKSSAAFWNLEYYQCYFDVDTKTVLQRCYGTLLPTSTNYLSTHLNPADLYGPFWTLSTLIFTLFLSSSLAASISAYLSAPGQAYDYNFQLLSIAMSLVYAYGIGLPVLLWIALRYLGVGEWSMVEAIAIWGYAQFVWIPVSIICVVPVPVVRWGLVFMAFGSSGYFLVRNVYPILAAAEAKATRLLIIVIAVLHAALALTFKILFFGYYVVDKIGVDLPVPGADPATNTTVVSIVHRAVTSLF